MRSGVFNGLALMVSLSNHGQHRFFSILLVQPEASSRPDSRERSSELASDKLY
jgi:hypothetical protein